MLAFLAQRLVQAVVVMLTVALVAFLIFRYVGDPIAAIVSQDTTVEEREALRHQLGLTDPAPVQFWHFISHAVRGDFGMSYQLQRPVGALILEKLPATLELSLTAAVLAVVVGIPMGVYTGLKPRGWLSRFLLAISLAGVSLPTFLIGILLILVFAVLLGWLPSYGRGQVVAIGGWTTGFLTLDGWRALILPATTLALYQLTLIMRLVRAEMLEVMRTDYIRFARARGLGARAIHYRHALRNSLVPVITVTGVQLGQIVAFSIITETVFQWPGVGLMFVQAINFADMPVMAAYLVLVALIIVTINLVVDLLYHLVDPRLRRGGPGVR